MTTRTPIASKRWLLSWAVEHLRITRRPPRLRHLHLARILHLGGADAGVAALSTAAAPEYEAALHRLGGDVEGVSLRVRKLLLTAALTAPTRS